MKIGKGCKINVLVGMLLFLWVVPCLGQSSSHWSDDNYQSTYSKSHVQRETHADWTRNVFSEATGNACLSYFELRAQGGYSLAATHPSATLSTGKRMKHTGPSHTPISAVAAASGSMSFSSSASGTAVSKASSSGSASASGAISGLGQSTQQKSIAVNGSCSATSNGSVSISKDGANVSSTSPPPGSFSGADTHSASFSPSNYQFSGSTTTVTASLSAVSSGSAVSSTYWLVLYGSSSAAGRAYSEISGLTLDVDCLTGG